MDSITQILQHWGLGNAPITPIAQLSTQTTWNIGGKYILKRFQNIVELSKGTRFAELLTPHEIPVAVFIPTKDGQLTSPDGLHCLMTKLPGKHADFYSEPDLAFEMGRELARLHIALSDVESKIECYDSNLLEDWQKKIKPSLSDLSEDIVKKVDSVFCGIYDKLPRQLIHRDVHLHNVLFDDGHLSGWLDFDIGQRNVRIFDITYLLSGLLIGNIHEPEKIKTWHRVFCELLQGYEEVIFLSKDESDALPVLMIVIEFLFVRFWSEHGNTEQRDVAQELAVWLFEKYMRGNHLMGGVNIV